MVVGTKRSFTVEESSVHIRGGRYISLAPMDAAKKAARTLFTNAKGEHKSIRMVIKETTSGSSHDFFSYTAHKIALPKPYQTRTIGDKVITYKHKYEVEACP